MHTAQEMYRQLIDKSSVDADFRRRLKEDPKAAIQQELGIEVQDDIAVHVHENDMNTIHLSIPAQASELPEEQLEAIAAGRCCCCY